MSGDRIPEAVAAKAQERGFGELVAQWEVHPRRRFRAALVATGATLVLAAGAFALAAAMRGAQPVWSVVLLVLGAGTLGFALLRVPAILRSRRDLDRAEYCFRGGIVSTAAGRVEGAYGFSGAPLTDEVARTGCELRFDDPVGGEWRLRGEAAHRAQVHPIVSVASAQVRAGEILAAVQAGEPVDLRTVTLGGDELRLPGGEPIPYTAVRGIEAVDGEWRLEHGDGAVAAAPIAATLDYRAFAALIASLPSVSGRG